MGCVRHPPSVVSTPPSERASPKRRGVRTTAGALLGMMRHQTCSSKGPLPNGSALPKPVLVLRLGSSGSVRRSSPPMPPSVDSVRLTGDDGELASAPPVRVITLAAATAAAVAATTSELCCLAAAGGGASVPAAAGAPVPADAAVAPAAAEAGTASGSRTQSCCV